MDEILELLLSQSKEDAMQYLCVLIFNHPRYEDKTNYLIPNKIDNKHILISIIEDNIKFFNNDTLKEIEILSDFEFSKIFYHLKILKEVLYERSDS